MATQVIENPVQHPAGAVGRNRASNRGSSRTASARQRDGVPPTAVPARRAIPHRDDGSHTPPHGDALVPSRRPR